MSAPDNPFAVVLWAAEHAPESLHVVDFAGLVRRARVRKVAVPTPPGMKVAKVERGEVLADVPAMVARALQAPQDERDMLVLIHVRREVVQMAESGIVLPPRVVVS